MCINFKIFICHIQMILVVKSDFRLNEVWIVINKVQWFGFWKKQQVHHIFLFHPLLFKHADTLTRSQPYGCAYWHSSLVCICQPQRKPQKTAWMLLDIHIKVSPKQVAHQWLITSSRDTGSFTFYTYFSPLGKFVIICIHVYLAQ